MDLTTLAALVFAIASIGVVAFQIALALGAPWGRFAMGGAFPGRFPPRMRIAAAVQAVLIAVLALVVLSAVGLVLPDLALAFPWLVWVAVAVSALALDPECDQSERRRTPGLGPGRLGAPRLEPDRRPGVLARSQRQAWNGLDMHDVGSRHGD